MPHDAKILVVDPLPTVRKIILRILGQAGYSNFLEAGDGVDALAALDRSDVHLMLTAWQMPRMDGLSLVREVRARDQDTRIVMVTTRADRQNVVTALLAGAHSYVIKPFTPDLLLQRVREALSADGSAPAAGAIERRLAGSRLCARDVMSTNVITIRPSAPLSEAIDLMLSHHISGLPVCTQGEQVVGMLTERDLLTAQDLMAARSTTVEFVMSSPVMSVSEETPIERIVEILLHKGFKRVPVVRDCRLVGVISRQDILTALFRREAVHA